MKRNLLATICAAMVAFVAGTTACVSVPPEKPGAIRGTMRVAVYFLDAAGKLLPPEAIPEDLTLQLGAIPGSLGGRVGVPLQTIHIGHDSEIELDLDDLSAKVASQAAQVSDGAPLQIAPQDTKFARVSTAISFSPHDRTVLAVGFWDPGAKGSVTLLYCDRPCRLRSSSASRSADNFDFKALSAGLVWMLAKKDRRSHFMHTRAVNPHPAVVICPPEAYDKIADTLANAQMMGRH